MSTYTHGQNNQNRIASIKIRLDDLTDDIPQLKNKVSFTVSDITLYEFLRALGTNNKLNLDVAADLKNPIAINLSKVAINDLIVYLCEQYELEILINGNIISIVKYSPPLELPPPQLPKTIVVTYNNQNKTISFDLNADTLGNVLKKITGISGLNIFSPNTLSTKIVSGFVKDIPIIKGLKELGYVNGLSFIEKDSNTFYFEDVNVVKPIEKEATNILPNGLKLSTNHKDSVLSIQAFGIPIKDVLNTVAKQLNINYFVFADIKGSSDLKVSAVDFNSFLKYLFNGTDYSYRYSNGVYLIGERKLEEIRSSTVYKLQYRTVTKILDHIPGELKKGVELIALPETNSIVIAGSDPAIKEITNFLRQIDKVVPVVNIELIILDIRKSAAISTGLMAGIDNSKQTSTYTSLYPTIDMTLSANTINNIIDGINGTGLVNLGKVTPSFYFSLKLSEDNGYLKVKSTPRLSTLNGNEAHMSIGESRYYSEQTTNVITTQSTTTVTGVVFKELQANFSINIKPIVSGDEQITLDISVEQSTFTEQFTKNGPYGRLTRSFKSSVRVKNNDMILLGGLEEKNNTNAGQGVPFLSRVPGLKWLFSSRSSSTKKSKLAILIHPTVFY